MAVCFYGNGTIVPVKKKGSTLIEDFKKLCEQYDNGTEYDEYENGALHFQNYVRWYFIQDVEELLEAKKDEIGFAQLTFMCYDEDGSVEKPFPFFIMYEVVDGNVFESTMETRLPAAWEAVTFDDTLDKEK